MLFRSQPMCSHSDECTWYFTRNGFRHDIYVNPNGIILKWRFGGKQVLWGDVENITYGDDITIHTSDASVTFPNLGGLEDYMEEIKYKGKEKIPSNGKGTSEERSSSQKGGSEWLQ